MNTIIKGMYGNVNVIFIIMYVHIQCRSSTNLGHIIILYEIRRYVELRVGIERYMYNGGCIYKTSCSMHE